MPNAEIVASGLYVPDKILNNEYFASRGPYRVYTGQDKEGNPLFKEERTYLDNEKIIETTGIKERRRISDNDELVDLVERAYAKTNFPASELSGILVGTVSHTQAFPSLACEIQERIKADNVRYTADTVAACSGFTHALDHARLSIQESGGYYLVVGVETLTRITDYEEINCDLFGDGCGLVVIGASKDEDKGILATAFASKVSGIRWIYKDKLGKLRMPQGKSVMKMAVRGMIDLAHELIEKKRFSKDDIDFYIPHQANGRIIEGVRERVDPKNKGKVIRNIERYGNMSSATIPVALVEAIENKIIKRGDLVASVDMGSGLAFGGALIRV